MGNVIKGADMVKTSKSLSFGDVSCFHLNNRMSELVLVPDCTFEMQFVRTSEMKEA